jgi:O-antigen ligase
VMAVLFLVEGLWRTRWVVFLGIGIVLGFALLIPVAKKLPLPMQRTLSVLPIEVDPIASADARGTVEWRLLMWQAMLPELPKYFWLGKGYSLNPTELFLTKEAARRGLAPDYAESLAVGDYHSGPLSVYVPFGMPGVLAFLVFIATGTVALWRNMKYGAEEVSTWNRFLFTVFVVKFMFFVVVFGSISSDLQIFTGTLGLSVALNRGVVRKSAPARQKAGQSTDTYGLTPASA